MFLKTYQTAIPVLQKYGLCERVEYLFVWGEMLPPVTHRELQSVFPRATIVVEYGASETQTHNIGLSVGDYGEKGSVFEPSRDLYIELIDPESGTVIREEGQIGELLVTSLFTAGNPTPLIRYRLGDLIEYTKYDEDPWERRFVVLGRKETEMCDIPHGQIRLFECHRAIAACRELRDYTFQLHITNHSEKFADATVELLILESSSSLPADIARTFSDNLQVAPSVYYSAGVDSLEYPEIACRKVSSFESAGQKHVYLKIEMN